MVVIFILMLPFYSGAYIFSPHNIGLITDPAGLPDWVGLCFGLVAYFAAQFGGLLQLYNLAERGFSLRLLIEIYEAEHCLTLDELLSSYSGGRGVSWMYEKRIRDMQRQGLITVEKGFIYNAGRGMRSARMFSEVKGFLQLPSSLP